MALTVPAWKAGQIATLAIEHATVRRRGNRDLADSLRAYGRFHARRARSARWELSPLHSVVMPAYSHAEFLADAIGSVMSQSWRPLELIVVDDASPDHTPDVIREMREKVPEDVDFRPIRRRRNRGQSAALNLGVMNARGSVVTIADADDYLFGNAIRLAREVLEQQHAWLFGAGNVMFRGELPEHRDVTVSASELPITRYTPEDVFRNPTEMNLSHTGSTFIRSAWRAVRGYRPIVRSRMTFANDREFHLRLASLFPVVVAPEVPFAYWRLDSSVDLGRFT